MSDDDPLRGSFDPPHDTDCWPDTGRLVLTLEAALARGDGTFPLVIELRRRDGRWDRECVAEAPGFNGELHELTAERRENGNVWRFRGLIKPDPWVVVGGPLDVGVTLAADSDGGAFAGEFVGDPIAGRATVEFHPRHAPSRGMRSPRLAILEDASGRLWDFSRAGHPERDAPEVPADLPVFPATDFGVRADSGEECAPGIQATIDAAAAAGGGVVDLPAGVLDYRVDAWQPPLQVRDSRIVVRGAGSGPNGTVLVCHRYADYAAKPKQPWKAGQWPIFRFEGLGPAAAAAQMGTDAPADTTLGGRVLGEVRTAARGSRTLTVGPGHAVVPGAICLLVHEEVADLSLARSLIGEACEPAANYRDPGAQLVRQLVEVTGVAGQCIELADPVHWTRQEDWPARLLEVKPLHGVGLTGLRLRGHWDAYYVHHKSPEHDNGWDQVGWQWCVDGFVRDLVHENCTTAVGMGNCLHCTVADLQVGGNPGHNGICLGGAATACLLVRCHLERPMHAINLAGAPCGNVIHDCRMGEPAGLDLHGGTGLDNLVDRLVGGVLVGGGSPAHVPPRHGPGLVMWNWVQGHRHPYKAWRRVPRLATWHETPGFIAVGVHAGDGHHLVYEGPDGLTDADLHDDRAWVEALNQAVHPSSLYRYQL